MRNGMSNWTVFDIFTHDDLCVKYPSHVDKPQRLKEHTAELSDYKRHPYLIDSLLHKKEGHEESVGQ